MLLASFNSGRVIVLLKLHIPKDKPVCKVALREDVSSPAAALRIFAPTSAACSRGNTTLNIGVRSARNEEDRPR